MISSCMIFTCTMHSSHFEAHDFKLYDFSPHNTQLPFWLMSTLRLRAMCTLTRSPHLVDLSTCLPVVVVGARYFLSPCTSHNHMLTAQSPTIHSYPFSQFSLNITHQKHNCYLLVISHFSRSLSAKGGGHY